MRTMQSSEAPPAAESPVPAVRPTSFLVRALGWLLGLAALAALAWFAWPLLVPAAGVPPTSGAAGPRRGAAGPPPSVVAVAAHKGEVPIELDGLGTVTPLQTVTVRSRVDGQLLSVGFEEGQMVEAGQVLAEVDPRPFAVQKQQAEGQLARDLALLENAQLDLERYRALLAQESGSKQQFDTQQSLVHQLEGTVAIDRGLVAGADLQLDYAHVKAPFRGRAGLRLVDAGNVVHASDPGGIVVLTQMDPIAVVFPIPQDDLPPVLARLAAGATLAVTAFDRQQLNALAQGVLASVDNQIDAIGTVRLKARFDNRDGRLFPNQFVNARLLVDTRHDALLVPASAVQIGGKGSYVYVVGPDHKVALRSVQTGPAAGSDVSIESGLAPGELVVVDGTDRLRDGAQVQLAGEAPAPTSAAERPRGGHAREGKK